MWIGQSNSQAVKLTKTGIRTQGEVVDIHSERRLGRKKVNTYDIVTISYQDDKGQAYSIVVEISGHGDYSLGSKVDIVYDKNNPARAAMPAPSRAALAGRYLLIFILSVGFIAVCVFVAQKYLEYTGQQMYQSSINRLGCERSKPQCTNQ
jgi:hypothetical protein